MYGIDRVAGDTAVMPDALSVGDVLRTYSGFADTVTVAGIERTMSQGLRYRYSITLDDGSRIERRQDECRHLATGPARVPWDN